MTNLNKDFKDFVSSLDEKQLSLFPKDYLDFCGQLLDCLDNKPTVYFTAHDHIGLRYEKCGKVLSVEVSDFKNLDVMDIIDIKGERKVFTYKINNFTVEKLNEIINRFVDAK